MTKNHTDYILNKFNLDNINEAVFFPQSIQEQDVSNHVQISQAFPEFTTYK